MEQIYASLSVSMSEFKKNPSRIKQEAGIQPVAVLNHNKPAFYLLDPEVYEAMLDRLEDISLSHLVHERLAMKEQAIEVDIDTI
jgi:antitoxin StbD